MTSDAPTNARKHVTPNMACPRGQRYTDDSVFWLAQIRLYVMAFRNLPPFVATKRHFRCSDKLVVDTSSYVTLRYNVRHLGHSEDWLVFVSLTTCTCNVWRNALSRICRSIGRHVKRSVDTLISVRTHLCPQTGAFSVCCWRCWWSWCMSALPSGQFLSAVPLAALELKWKTYNRCI